MAILFNDLLLDCDKERRCAMSVPKPISNWKFEIIIDQNDFASFAKSAGKIPPVFKSNFMTYGLALAYGQKYLENRVFHALEDGTLHDGVKGGLNLVEVEIDLISADNARGLRNLDMLYARKQARESAESFEERGFRVVGYQKGNHNIHVLGFDDNGLFLSDLRKSWDSSKIRLLQPLP